MHHWMMRSAAWLDLSPQERAAYLEIGAHYVPGRNGYLAVSCRTVAQRCNMSKDTAAKSIRALIEHGFIECTQEGAFHVKTRLAAEYRLTAFPCDRTNKGPTKEFMKWKPSGQANAKNGPDLGTARSATRDSEVRHAA